MHTRNKLTTAIAQPLEARTMLSGSFGSPTVQETSGTASTETLSPGIDSASPEGGEETFSNSGDFSIGAIDTQSPESTVRGAGGQATASDESGSSEVAVVGTATTDADGKTRARGEIDFESNSAGGGDSKYPSGVKVYGRATGSQVSGSFSYTSSSGDSDESAGAEFAANGHEASASGYTFRDDAGAEFSGVSGESGVASNGSAYAQGQGPVFGGSADTAASGEAINGETDASKDVGAEVSGPKYTPVDANSAVVSEADSRGRGDITTDGDTTTKDSFARGNASVTGFSFDSFRKYFGY